MILLGRAAITAGVFGFVALFAASLPSVREVVLGTPVALAVFNALSALAALGLFVGWWLGIYHWGTDYVGRYKGLWGVAVIPGAFLGAFAYWWFAAKKRLS